MSNSVILGLLRAIREGDADAVLPLSDALEEAGRDDCAKWVRDLWDDSDGTLNADVGMLCEWTVERFAEDCPECGGKGYISDGRFVYSSGSVREIPRNPHCRDCRGTGVRLKEPSRAVFGISPDRTITLDESAFANGPILITNPGPGMLTVQLPDGFTSTSVSPGTSLGFAPDSWPFDSACPYLPESSP